MQFLKIAPGTTAIVLPTAASLVLAAVVLHHSARGRCGWGDSGQF